MAHYLNIVELIITLIVGLKELKEKIIRIFLNQFETSLLTTWEGYKMMEYLIYILRIQILKSKYFQKNEGSFFRLSDCKKLCEVLIHFKTLAGKK